MTPRLHVVGLGIGRPCLAPEAAAAVASARVLVGGRRQLALAEELFPGHPAERIPIAGPLDAVLGLIRARLDDGLAVAVLADGDPLFYGIGSRLLAAFGPEAIAFHPGTTAVQAAAARLGLPWQDLPAVSLHGRADQAPLFAALARHRRVAVYTDGTNTPAAVARALLARGAGDAALTVLEDLGGPDERIRRLSPAEAAPLDFSALNLVLVDLPGPPLLPLSLGTPDELYVHEKGLITKWPVRAAGIAALRLRPDSTLWDLGAGCGAVAIEASTLLPRGRVVAVERQADRIDAVRVNIRRFHAWGVEPVHGQVPDCLDGLPDPDRIFIGGGVGRDTAALEAACARLAPGGRIVLHLILLGSLARARDYLEWLGWPVTVTLVQAGRSACLAGDLRLEGDNPVFILAADKPGETANVGEEWLKCCMVESQDRHG